MRKYLLYGAGGCVFLCVVCVVLSLIGSATGLLPDANATSTAEAAAEVAANNETATIVALTPSSTPTLPLTPSVTPIPSNTLRPPATPVPSATPTFTNTPLPSDTPAPTNTPTIQERAQDIIENTRGTRLQDDEIENVAVNPATSVIVLRYGLREAVLSTGEYLDQANNDFPLLICALRDEFPGYEYWFTATAPGTNAFGEDVDIEAVEMELSAANAARINCENTSAINLAVIAERFDIHPDLR